MTDLTKNTFYTRFNRPKFSGITFPEPSRTKQEFMRECDINNIVKNPQCVLPELIKANPQYGDFSDLPTYQDSLNVIATANDQFHLLSSRVRERFANDPAKFLEFCNDPKNAEEMRSLGLAKPNPAPPEPKGEPNPPKAPAAKKTPDKGD